MKILFIDTSSFNVTISYIEDNVIKFIFNDEIRDDMSSKIMPIIRDGSIESSIELSDLDRIIVCNGPGSFTGIRIGVTIAKTIAWALKKDIITISTLELYASTSFDTKYIIPMINARRGYVYAGVYDNNLNNVVSDKYIYMEDLNEYFAESTLVSYDDIENTIKPNIDLVKLINKHINDEPISCHAVNPNYLKLTEAEMNLNRSKND